MRAIVMSHAVLVVAVGMSSASSAQDQGSKAAVQKKLESEYALTKTTDDRTDIVTAGAVLVLQKDKLEMVAASTNGIPCPNTYKDGIVNQNAACRAAEKMKKMPMFAQNANQGPATRYFVTGEKFWVTKIDVKDTGRQPSVVMELFSDAIGDIRYKTSLTIPFKGGLPSADEALTVVREVVTVAPAENAKGNAGAVAPQSQKPEAPAAPAERVAEAPPAPIEPPPPPADEATAAPAAASLGQTPDQVVQALGQPLKKAKAGAKEIYYYKSAKVTFVNGKVTDIQ